MSNRNLILAAAGAGGEPTDPNFNQTVLLLHGDGTNGAQNNTFLDSSTNNFTITRNGNATQGTFSPFSLPNGEWSNYLNGIDQYLSFADNADFAMGSGDFTIEGFFYTTASATQQVIIGQGNSSDVNISFFVQITTNGRLEGVIGNGSVLSYATGASAVPVNAWNHFAYVRDGNTCRIYLNGVQDATDSVTGVTMHDSAQALAIGRLGEYNGLYFKGYTSNIRVIKGTCLYPNGTTFTVPTSPFSTSTSNQKLLTCYSNRFVDANTATTAKTVTVGGTPSVQPFSPFLPTAEYDASVNGGSGYFDGTGDYLNTASGNNAISFGTSAYTVEAWIYQKARSDTQWICGGGGTTFQLGITSTGLVFGSVAGGANMTSSTIAVPLNSWTHVVIVRSSTSAGGVAYYINGVAAGTATDSANHSATGTVNVATTNNNGGVSPINGYMANFRVVKGSAVYTAAFTPPTAPLTAISGTSLLCNFTNAGIFDNTGKNNLETSADAQIDTTTVKYGTGSLEFDGNGDYLVRPASDFFAFGTGDFTIEYWAYKSANGVNNYDIVCGSDNDGSGTNGWYLEMSNTRGMLFLVNTATALSYSFNPNTSTWTHYALVRSNGTVTFYVNGTSAATGTFTTSIPASNRFSVGAGNLTGVGPGLFYFNGFIDDLRITKGVARYTANFTPPDAPFLDK